MADGERTSDSKNNVKSLKEENYVFFFKFFECLFLRERKSMSGGRGRGRDRGKERES